MNIEVTFTVEARPAAAAVSLTRTGGAAVPGDTTFDADSVSFVDVQRADAGEYTLTSDNVAGVGSGTFILDVQCKLRVCIHIIMQVVVPDIIPSHFILIESLHSKCNTTELYFLR